MKYVVLILLLAIIIQPLSIQKLDVPFIYQLQNISLKKIYTYYNPKYLIIDIQSNIDKTDLKYLEKLKSNGTIILSYISIGEAEDYRDYWTKKWYSNPPEWLGSENPDWTGNYKVKYWYNEWKKIIFNEIDKILSYNIDGLYLDRIDSYLYWSKNGYSPDFTANEMIKLIKEISQYVKSKGKFLIVPQNGEEILDFDINNDYINSIDGIGIETLFYKGKKAIDSELTKYRLNYILKIQKKESLF